MTSHAGVLGSVLNGANLARQFWSALSVVTPYRQSAGKRLREVLLGRTVPSKKTPRGECPIAALSSSHVTDEANFGWRCWRRACPRTRGGQWCTVGLAQIAAGIDGLHPAHRLQRYPSSPELHAEGMGQR